MLSNNKYLKNSGTITAVPTPMPQSNSPTLFSSSPLSTRHCSRPTNSFVVGIFFRDFQITYLTKVKPYRCIFAQVFVVLFSYLDRVKSKADLVFSYVIISYLVIDKYMFSLTILELFCDRRRQQ